MNNKVEVKYSCINRSALVVGPEKEFFDWVERSKASVDPSAFRVSGMDSKTVFMLPQYEGHAEYELYLKEVYDEVLECMLNVWIPDQSEYWPKDVSYEQFTEWFSCEVQSLVFDLNTKEKFEYEEWCP